MKINFKVNGNMEIPDDAVFIPGHSGDLIGGSQLIKAFDISLDYVYSKSKV